MHHPRPTPSLPFSRLPRARSSGAPEACTHAVGKRDGHAPHSTPRRDRAYSRRPGFPRSAFTLTEILVVMGIILLFVTLALPAFNLISGTKSIAGGENVISALLAETRNQAIGVQDYRGLAIYRDAATDRYAGTIVSFVTYTAWNPTTTYTQYSYVTYPEGTAPNQVTHYFVAEQNITAGTLPTAGYPSWSECAPGELDIATDSDLQTFPAGVGVQVINNFPLNTSVTPPTRASNGYLPIGIILFNGEGMMKLSNVSIATNGHLGAIGNISAYASQGAIPYYSVNAAGAVGGLSLSSAFGLVVFDKQSFETQNFYTGLPSQLTQQAINSSTNSNYPSNTQEQAADAWLDANSTPLLINRYNGTLIRSE